MVFRWDDVEQDVDERRSLRTGIDVILTVLAALLAVVAYQASPSCSTRPSAAPAPPWPSVSYSARYCCSYQDRNSLEDRGTIPALLKAPPSPWADPLADPQDARGHVDLATVLLVLAVELLLVLILLVAGRL